MTTSLSQLLDEIRSIKRSERDVGDRFEEIVQVYFNHDAQMQQQYEDAVSWSEWVRREEKDETRQDTGIDLVAKIRPSHGGGFAAIQAKCYDRDAVLRKEQIDSFFTTAKTHRFKRLIFIDTTESTPSKHFQEIIDKNQITHIRVHDLEDSTVDWDAFVDRGERSRRAQKEPRPHQIEAVERVQQGLRTADRGQLIMACGTGKTYTGLLIAEQAVGIGKRVLVLVPSLALMSQMIREWHADATIPLRSYSVCSDSEVGRKGRNTDDVIQLTPSELKLPPTTDAFKLAQSARKEDADSLTVVFGTYHSLEVIHDAQHKQGLPDFDLIVCDEAHRTTGQYDKGKEDEASMFVRVHDANYVRSSKRLYMTATPRIYTTASKTKASDGAIELCSMDDPTKFGEVWFYKSFAWAVEQNLLSDYRVLVLAVDETTISRDIQKVLESDDSDIKLDDATKVVGCYKALMKVSGPGREEEFRGDTAPSRRVLAFCNTIRNSKIISREFDRVVQELAPDHIAGEASPTKFTCSTKHIDGTSGAHERNRQLSWLGDEPNKHELRILSNVRCLGEGVDVPSLDAIVFFHPRKSQIDVVQAVGRVMRRAPKKQYGYVVLPVAIPTGKSPEEALRDNKTYDTVWQILNALRAHDERLEAEINRLQLEGEGLDRVMIKMTESALGNIQSPTLTGSGNTGDGLKPPVLTPPNTEHEIDIFDSLSQEFATAIYAQIVRKVGRKAYWEDWAHDVGKIAQTQTTRIRSALDLDEHSRGIFQEFLAELQDDLNPAVTEDQAIELLAQHIITRPVFNALFSGHEFIEQNSVSIAMEKVLNELDQRNLEKETESLQEFYKEVKWRIAGTKTAGAKQHLVKELYDKFFRKAFPRTTEMLGIAFTPVEIVDYVIHSIEHLMQKHFNKSLSDEGVHIIDPFVGTGTFITRLLQSGIIRQEDLRRKYEEEIHANEIVLLAYYVAGINIEAVYHEIRAKENLSYEPYERIVFQDTFQSTEHTSELSGIFPLNHERIDDQQCLPLTVVFGNPPYSRGQKSQNDNAQNVLYPLLDASIRKSYAQEVFAYNKNSLYDSYIRAFRWATDRLAIEGIVGFVTGSGWLDGNAAAGMRACFAREFTHIYVVNLRGNARTKGEDRRKEAGNVFDAASRSAITLTFLVKDWSTAPAHIHYYDIGDYLTREQKLTKLQNFTSVERTPFWRIKPNKDYDWINQRNPQFSNFLSLRVSNDGSTPGLFSDSSLGSISKRDAWCYNFSVKQLRLNISKSIAFYNEELARYLSESKTPEPKDFVKYDRSKISWSPDLFQKFKSGKVQRFDQSQLRLFEYRPMTRIWCYFDRNWVASPGRIPHYFPFSDTQTQTICTTGIGVRGPGAWVTSLPVDVETIFHCRAYPLIVAPTNEILARDTTENLNIKTFQSIYSNLKIHAEQLFHYAYGILSCPEFLERFQQNLEKETPRIPAVETVDEYLEFVSVGKQLTDLHSAYEQADEYSLTESWVDASVVSTLDEMSKYRVVQMKFSDKNERSKIQYNSYLKLSGIPEEAYEFKVNGKSLVEWVMDRQRVTTHKESGIVNNANDFAIETMNDPAYPLRLLKKAITVGIKTRELQRSMPLLKIHPKMGG